MHGSRFDNVSKLFAQRRLSRRVLARGGAGLAVGALAATHFNTASAQDGTPVAPGDQVVKTDFLFVQSFQQGSIAPKDGEDGTFILTLEQGLGQTIYFSDRPERIVGASPTQTFLDGLGFSDDNPPNAALVVEPAPGETDIAVLELFNPRYDEASHTATYDVQVLKDYEQAIGVSLAEAPKDLAGLQSQFGAAHLFIDGCPDGAVVCVEMESNETIGQFNNLPYCYWYSYGCIPCAGDGFSEEQIVAYWTQHCNNSFSACGSNCTSYWHNY